jgi:hypothetical protein
MWKFRRRGQDRFDLEAELRQNGVRSLRLIRAVGFTVLVLVGLGAFSGIAIASPAIVQYVDDVVICHNPDGPNPQSLSVPPSAVEGHLGHGDVLGPCEPEIGGVLGALDEPGQSSGDLESGGLLPFTGLNLALVVIAGGALLAAGLMLRRRDGSRRS